MHIKRNKGKITNVFGGIIMENNLSEEEIIKYNDWDRISNYQYLTESFIRKYQDKINWEFISKYQKLSEDLIIEFKNKVDWFYIARNQNLSETFIRNNIEKLDIRLLLQNIFISEKLKQDMRICYDILS